MTYLHEMPKRLQQGEWWKSYFDAQYLLEHEPLFTFERDRHEVSRLMDLLGLPSGARVLDVPCGQGRHAHLFAEAGFDVDGFDYSEDLLARARQRGTGPRLRYTRGDMRKLPTRWTRRFDALVNLWTSFGFFINPADDQQVIHEFARVLKPGGLALISDFRATDHYAKAFAEAGFAVDLSRGSILESFPPLRIVAARKPAIPAV